MTNFLRVPLNPLIGERRNVSVFDPRHGTVRARGRLPPDSHPMGSQCRRFPTLGVHRVPAGDEKHQRFTLLARQCRMSSASLGRLHHPVPGSLLCMVAVRRGIGLGSGCDLGQAFAHLGLPARSLGPETHEFAGFDHDATATQFAVPVHDKVRPRSLLGTRETLSCGVRSIRLTASADSARGHATPSSCSEPVRRTRTGPYARLTAHFELA